MRKVGLCFIFFLFAIALIELSSAQLGFDNPDLPRVERVIEDVKAFLGLSDTPSSYSGSGGLCVAINSGATALTFQNCTNASSSIGDADYWRLDGTNAPPSANWDMGSHNLTADNFFGRFGNLISEQNPDGADAFRIKGTDYVDVVIGGMTGLFAVWT